MPFNRFLAFGSNVFDILVLYRVYFSTCSLMFIVWVLPIWRRSGFKKLDSKTIGCSIQSFFEISATEQITISQEANLMNSCIHVLLFSVAKCLGAVKVCERSFEWTKQHNLISHVIEDVEAVESCLKFLGEYNIRAMSFKMAFKGNSSVMAVRASASQAWMMDVLRTNFGGFLKREKAHSYLGNEGPWLTFPN